MGYEENLFTEFDEFSKKFFMKIGSSTNSKISAELSYTGQRVRVIPKATCNIKKVTI